MSKIKPGFTISTHISTAAQLHHVRTGLRDALIRTCAAYPIQSKQVRLLDRAVREVDRARSELDNVFYREQGDEVRSPYYGRNEERSESDTAEKMIRAGITREPLSGCISVVRLRITDRSVARSAVEITCMENEVAVIVDWALEHLECTRTTALPVPEYVRVPWGPEYRWTSAAEQHFERVKRLCKSE